MLSWQSHRPQNAFLGIIMGLVCQEASTLTQGPHFNLIFNLFSIKDTAWGAASEDSSGAR